MNDRPSHNQDAAVNAAILKAMTDADFRTQLLEDPRSALQQENVDIPSEINIKVAETSPDEMLIPLPPPLSADGAPLSDSELEAVSGGIWWIGVIIGLTTGDLDRGVSHPDACPPGSTT